MICHEVSKPKYSFIMAPFYCMEDDWLMKSQLNNLSFITSHSFEVIIPDPHYSKRKWLSEYAKKQKYNIIHFPYVPNTKVPKSFDYAILNHGILMASSETIITFQDWRFVNRNILDVLNSFHQYDYIGLKWQLCIPKEEDLITYNINNYEKIIQFDQAQKMLQTGMMPELKEKTSIKNPPEGIWGHWCISKNLLIEINGIDELATNTKHYADLDLERRLENFYKLKNKPFNVPKIENVMFRTMHQKGNYFGTSNIPIDYNVNQKHLNCCHNQGGFNDLQHTNYVVDKIKEGQYQQLSVTKYDDYISKINNPKLDKQHGIIRYYCNKCNLVSETYHWYEKIPFSRIKASVGIGKGDYKLGRNLEKIKLAIENKNFQEKVTILNNSWYEEDFLK